MVLATDMSLHFQQIKERIKVISILKISKHASMQGYSVSESLLMLGRKWKSRVRLRIHLIEDLRWDLLFMQLIFHILQKFGICIRDGLMALSKNFLDRFAIKSSKWPDFVVLYVNNLRAMLNENLVYRFRRSVIGSQPLFLKVKLASSILSFHQRIQLFVNYLQQWTVCWSQMLRQ